MESHPDGIMYHKESDRFKGDKLVTYALAQFVVTATIFAVVFFFSLSSPLSPSLRIGKAYRNWESLPKS